MSSPWTDGPRELIQHAVDHLASGGDFDRRIAMVSVDNAVELSIKTWLGLPERARGRKGPGRRELEDASESFPALLDLLQKYGADKIVGMSFDDIEWYHRLRNQLYHSGNGITVEKSKVETYLELAVALFQSLFGEPPTIDYASSIRSKTGEFLEQWISFERQFRQKLPPKKDFAYFWKREFLGSISPEAVELYSSVSNFRNQLVHGLEEPSTQDIQNHIRLLKRLVKMIDADTA